MGKVKQQRRSVRARLNPIHASVTSSLNYDTAQTTEQKSETVLPVIEKLSSVDASERAWACACASNLVGQDHRTRKLLLSRGLVSKLVERLTDTELAVSTEAAGALRNLTVAGGYKVCTDMFNKNILTAMQRLVKLTLNTANEVFANVKPSDENAVARHRAVWSLAENLICIYWSLAEISSRILKSITKPDVLSFVLRFIEVNPKVPASLSIIAAQCLHTITEENRDALFYFRSAPEIGQQLFNMLSAQQIPEDRTILGVLLAGVLRNIRRTLPNSGDVNATASLNHLIAPILLSYLDWDIQGAAVHIAQIAPDVIKKRQEKHGLHEREGATEHENQLNLMEDRFAAMQLCLEILANMASEDTVEDDSKDDNEEEEEVDEWEDVDEDTEDAENAEDEIATATKESTHNAKTNGRALTKAEEKEIEALTNGHGEEEEEEEGDDTAMMDATTGQNVNALEDAEARIGIMLNQDGGRFFSQRLLPLLVRLAEPVIVPNGTSALAFTYTRREIPAVAELAILHVRALACLNNYLVLAAERSSHGWFAEHQTTDAPRLWHWLLDNVASRAQSTASMTLDDAEQRDTAEQEETRLEVLESALDCLWSMARGLGVAHIPATDAQIQALMNVAQGQMNNCSDHLRADCIGVLGIIAQRRPNYIEANQAIGNLLMTLVTSLPQTPAETAVEALNALYDVYDDATHDYDTPVFVRNGYLEALRNSVPAVRQMARRVDKQRHPVLHERAQEALVNLRAFIEYKSGERSASSSSS
ncbi:armadillo-type protein [Syncephalis plumigaleata]|nr:armadillo-type protein [Syncephalis plumigaleata]